MTEQGQCGGLGSDKWLDRQAGLGELLGSRSVRIGMSLFLLQQASGINAIVYFSSSVFAQAQGLALLSCVWGLCPLGLACLKATT